jgi:hypothetical protein
MKFAVRSITVIIVLLLLVSCVPTEARVQEAIMQTQAAQPTATSTPEPTATNTPEPTATATPEPTNTPEPTSTPGIKGCTDFQIKILGTYYVAQTAKLSVIMEQLRSTYIVTDEMLAKADALAHEAREYPAPACAFAADEQFYFYIDYTAHSLLMLKNGDYDANKVDLVHALEATKQFRIEFDKLK